MSDPRKKTRSTEAALGSMKGVGAKERPHCRQRIIQFQLRPFIDDAGHWNGFHAVRPDGTKSFLSDGMERQMGKMLREGFWSELLTQN